MELIRCSIIGYGQSKTYETNFGSYSRHSRHWSLQLPTMLKRQLKTGKETQMTKEHSAVVSVRYMIDDVDAAVAFYTKHLAFTLDVDAAPAFASVIRGNLRLLLSGEKSSGRKAMPDGTKPVPGGWNRILVK
jgi:hypothetical protein